jgi:two-component system sensor histidine kinase YesM
MYCENDTIINGGEFEQLKTAKDSAWYQYLRKSGLDNALYFDYDVSRTPAVEAKRKMLFLQKLNFYSGPEREKVLKIEMDYSGITRNLVKMNYDTNVYICWNDKIVLSNGNHASVGKNFEPFTEQSQVGYSQDMKLYGIDLEIYVLNTEVKSLTEITKNFPLILLLILINAILPIIMVRGFNRSFTVRIGELSEVFKNVENEHLIEIENVRGKDEIGGLMRSYNKMAERINDLIQIVYINKIQEQEMMVARQNAELLALHSQINPHFLFNALESIRMHSIIKYEMETADMVEKLAIMQRQYVEWGNDSVEIAKEMDFVRAYLGLQKYRFGDRLSYELDIEEDCSNYKIPKLSIVTFVENACVHGIESKVTPGWIFVRIYQRGGWLYLEIEDTGSGMGEAVVKELLSKMQQASIEMLTDKGRVGIINACLRLKMVSNDEVQFELDGEEGVGTMIQIRIPLKFV